MKKLRIGVIGTGAIARAYHLPALAEVKNAELVWACDLIEERAKECKEKFGFEKYTLDYHDVLNDASVDAVCIFTKIEMHAILCQEAARAGKDIFSQKPFAYSIREGREIIKTVNECGVRLIPSFMHSYMAGSDAARKLVADGVIGQVLHIRMRNNTKHDPGTAPGYGGCMMDIGCHGMDLIHTVSGGNIRQVFALDIKSPADDVLNRCYGEEANLNGAEYTAILNYRLDNGVTAYHEILWSQISATNRFEMEIYGTKGAIYLYNPHCSDEVYYGVTTDGNRKHIQWQAAPLDGHMHGYVHHQTVVDALLDHTKPSKSPQDAFAPLQVVEAARRSFASGKIENVMEI